MRFLTLVMLSACVGSKDKGGSSESGYYYDSGMLDGEGGYASDTADSADNAEDGDVYEPETESTVHHKPAATNQYLFVTNADRDTITRVSVPSLEIITTPVGEYPSLVKATEDQATAVSLNRGSNTLSIIDADSLDVRSVDIREDMSGLELSPDSQWAVAWQDPADEDEDAPASEGAESFNEISLVNLGSGTHYPEVVGFHPTAVSFTEDGQLALIVSDTWLTLIDLSGATPSVRRVSLTDETSDAPLAEEVVVTADGRTALVRQFGATSLAVVDLVTGELTTVEVGTNPTDLDVSEDGRTAMVVARASHELWLLDTEDPTAPPRIVSLPADSTYGSLLLNEAHGQGLLYSTATGQPRYAVWDMATDAVTEYGLVKPVSSVQLNDEGSTALIFHPAEDGDDSQEAFSGHYAVSIVDQSDQFAVPLLLGDAPLDMAWSETGDAAYLLLEDKLWLSVLHTDSMLHDEIALKSTPIHVGVVPDSSLVWINQEHDLGRLSFYDSATGALSTLTGFELNAAIERE